jgi:hypothetical protein
LDVTAAAGPGWLNRDRGAHAHDPADSLRAVRTSGLLFLGLLVLVTAAVYVRGADLDPTARDQNADLAQAIRVREQGQLTDGSRSPLLPVLLAPMARRSPDFFVDARLVSVVLAALALLGCYLAVRKTFSPALALVASIVFLIEWRFQARRICPEPLLALFLVLATAVLAHIPSARTPRLLAGLAGGLLGLAWLAKGSALLSVFVALVWLVGWQGRRGLVRAGVLLVGFVFAGSPLIAFNLAHDRWPLANASSDHVMWEDAWDQDLDRTSNATLGTYLETHDLGDIVGRLGHGLLHQKAVEWPLGFLVLLLCAALLRRFARPTSELALPPAADAPRRAWRTLALLTCVIWLPPMAWYEPITLSRRLLFSVVPILLPAALDVLWGLLPGPWRATLTAARPTTWLSRAAPFAAAAAIVAAIVLAVRHGNPWNERHIDEPSRNLVERLSQPKYRGAVILAKPSRTLPPDWLLEGHVTFLAMPAAVSSADARAWIIDRAQYILFTPDFFLRRQYLHYIGDGEGMLEVQSQPWFEPADEPLAPPYWLLRVVRKPAPR